MGVEIGDSPEACDLADLQDTEQRQATRRVSLKQDIRQKTDSQDCPLTSTCMPWNVQSPHIYAHLFGE